MRVRVRMRHRDTVPQKKRERKRVRLRDRRRKRERNVMGKSELRGKRKKETGITQDLEGKDRVLSGRVLSGSLHSSLPYHQDKIN